MNPPLRSVSTPIKPNCIPVHPAQQQQQPSSQEQQQQQSQQSSQLSWAHARATDTDRRRVDKPGQGRADAANSTSMTSLMSIASIGELNPSRRCHCIGSFCH